MLYYSFILIFYLLFAFLTFRQVRWGVYLILLFLPSYQIRYQIFGLPMTLLEGMIWLLFIVWLIRTKFKIKNLKLNQNLKLKIVNLIPRGFRLPIILFLVAATISVFTSPNLQAALGIWKAYFIEVLLFFIVFVYNIRTLEHLKHTIRILGALTIVIGLFAIYQKLTGAFITNPYWVDEASRRITTFFGYPNANALLIAPIILLTIGNLLTDNRPLNLLVLKSSVLSFQSWTSRSFNLLVVILGILTILWTKSAGALIGLTFGLIAWLIFYKKTWIITVITLTIIFIITFSQSGIISYLKNSFNSLIYTDLPLSPSDLQIRYQQWKETLNLLKDTPIFGAGLAGYQTLMVPYHQFWHIEIFLYPHNFFLNFWTETGLLGLISIIWTIATFFIIGYQSTINNQQSTIKTLTLATICAMITLLIHGLVDVPYFKNDLAILFWVIIGIMVTLYQDTRNKFQDINKLQ